MTNEKKNNGGFTLMEVAVVVAIVGIVATIAIGAYLSWKPGNVFRAAVSQVQNDLMRAKMRAVETRRECRVVFDSGGYQIEDGKKVMNNSPGDWGKIDSNGTHTAGVPFRTENFSNLPQITLANDDGTPIVAGSEPTVTFSPRGRAISMDSVDVVHEVAGSAEISVNITGMVDITWQ